MTRAEILQNNARARQANRRIRRHLYVPVSNSITCRNIMATDRDPRTDVTITPKRKALR